LAVRPESQKDQALVRLVARELDVAESNVRVVRDPSGRPVLSEPEIDIRLSSSHSGGRVLVALARGVDVGVDLETTQRDPSGWALWSHVLTARELSALPNGRADRARALLAAWVAKEAILKGAGVGLSADPSELEIVCGRVEKVPDLLGSPHDWTVRPLPIAGFAAAVACRSEAIEIRSETSCDSRM
jgi:4'-phosphopantetheinyl transferase